MAQQVQTILVDDITGKEIAAGQGETISFSVGGVSYEIDLDDKGASKFYNTLQFYIDHGRKVGRGGAVKPRRKVSDVDPAAVRAWAKSKKITVSPRGRIAGDVIQQYKAAGN